MISMPSILHFLVGISMGTCCAPLLAGLFCCIAFYNLVFILVFCAIFREESESWLICFCFFWFLDVVWLLAHQRKRISTFVILLLESIIL